MAETTVNRDAATKVGVERLDDKNASLIFGGAKTILNASSFLASAFADSEDLNFSASQDELNSAVLTANANEIVRMGRDEIGAIASEGEKFKGDQIIDVVKSGAAVSGGDTAAIINETNYQVAKEMAAMELKTQVEKNAAQRKAKDLATSAKYKRTTAKQALNSAKFSAATQVVGGFARLGGGLEE